MPALGNGSVTHKISLHFALQKPKTSNFQKLAIGKGKKWTFPEKEGVEATQSGD